MIVDLVTDEPGNIGSFIDQGRVLANLNVAWTVRREGRELVGFTVSVVGNKRVCDCNDHCRTPATFENLVICGAGMSVGERANAGRMSEFEAVEGLIVVADNAERCGVSYEVDDRLLGSV